MKILLIRHGESTQNTGQNYTDKLVDFKIPLTEKGKQQATQCGIFLQDWIINNNFNINNIKVYVSSYLRTKQTWEGIHKNFIFPNDPIYDDRLIEHQFGVFDALTEEERAIQYSNEWNYYLKMKEQGGKYFARFHLGESPADVSNRIESFKDSLFRDYERNDTQLYIIISHGTTNRMFLKVWYRKDFEWFDKEPNFKNCEVKYINGYGKNKEDYQTLFQSMI